MIQRWNIEGDEVTPDDEGVYVLYAHLHKKLEADRDWMRLGQELAATSQTNREGMILANARAAYRAGLADGLRRVGCTAGTVRLLVAELEGK